MITPYKSDQTIAEWVLENDADNRAAWNAVRVRETVDLADTTILATRFNVDGWLAEHEPEKDVYVDLGTFWHSWARPWLHGESWESFLAKWRSDVASCALLILTEVSSVKYVRRVDLTSPVIFAYGRKYLYKDYKNDILYYAHKYLGVLFDGSYASYSRSVSDPIVPPEYVLYPAGFLSKVAVYDPSFSYEDGQSFALLADSYKTSATKREAYGADSTLDETLGVLSNSTIQKRLEELKKKQDGIKDSSSSMWWLFGIGGLFVVYLAMGRDKSSEQIIRLG